MTAPAPALDIESMTAMVQARLAHIESREALYDTDLPVFAKDCLVIRPIEGGDCPLDFNSDQILVHNSCEEQLKRKGWVRKLVLKARKTGVSTYVEARYYHKTSRGKGIRAFVLAHEQKTSDVIFDMTQRFHDHNPGAPHTGKANAKTLYFDVLDSGIAVGTAGTKAVGRGDTIQLFHWAEVAHSPNAEEIATGALEAVAKAPGTEIILESTANGASGLFYQMCQSAMRGVGNYELIFLAWFTHAGYSTPAPAGWRPPEKFVEYAYLHKLTRPQLYWAYLKNADLASVSGDSPDDLCWRFRQEFPSTIEEAFRAARIGRFISSESVLKARKFIVGPQIHAPVILGCDFAATSSENEGGDANLFIDRQGRRAGQRLYERFRDTSAVSVANKLGAIIERIRPAMCFLDTGGGGAQVYDILKTRGFADVMTLVNFGAGARDPRVYLNKRAEIWGEMRKWLDDAGGAQIPDCDILDSEITAPKGKPRLMDQRIQLEAKSEIKADLGFSPDGGDGLALTFAEPVRLTAPMIGIGAGSAGGGDPVAGY